MTVVLLKTCQTSTFTRL